MCFTWWASASGCKYAADAAPACAGALRRWSVGCLARDRMGDDPQALIRMIATVTHSFKYAREKTVRAARNGQPDELLGVEPRGTTATAGCPPAGRPQIETAS
jgi:hypothetical protein